MPRLLEADRGRSGALGDTVASARTGPEESGDDDEFPRRALRLHASPSPRLAELSYDEFPYRRTGAVRYLPVPAALCEGAHGGPTENGSYFEVLARRHTRAPAGPPTDTQLATLLWAVAKVHTEHRTRYGRWQHRSTPSAGGRHPIDLVLSGWGDPNGLLLYDPLAHAVDALAPAYPSGVAELAAVALACSGTRAGVAMWHVAQPRRTAARYDAAESLIWRDAGALIATTAMTCEALALACTPLGATGEPWLSAVLAGDGRVVGVGGCVIGSRSE